MSDGEATSLVDALLSELQGRSGFDHFWDGIDPETKGEIRGELVTIAGKHLDAVCFGAPGELEAHDDDNDGDGLPF